MLRRLGATESLEMVPVYACVLNDSALMARGIEQMKKCKDEMRKARREMCCHVGYEMSPAVLALYVLRK